MKLIYTLVFYCFLTNSFAQELNIGVVNKDSILSEMEQNGEIQIVGANYDVASGRVTFLEENVA